MKIENNTSLHLLIFIILAATLGVPPILFDNFQECGPELLSPFSVHKEDADWVVQGKPASTVTVTSGVLQIISSDDSSSLSIYQKLLPDPKFPLLRLQADLTIQNIVSGEQAWNKARLLLVQYIDGQACYQTRHVVAALDGTRNWRHYQGNFTIAPETESLRVIIQISEATGTLQAKELSLRPIQKNLWYKSLQSPARICLSLFLLYLIIPYLREKRSLLPNLFICLVTLAIIIAISLPSTTKKTLKNSVENEVNQVATTLQKQKIHIFPATLLSNIDSTKLGHFFIFFLLGLLLHAVQTKQKSLWILIDIFLIAMTTECIQLYIDGREALWSDVFIDCSGGFLGVILGMKRLKGKKRED